MKECAIEIFAFLAPSANRVYGRSAVQLASSELRVVLDAVSPGALVSLEPAQRCGIEGLSLVVSADTARSDAAFDKVLRSLAYSAHVFAAVEDLTPRSEDGPLWRPLELPRVQRHSSDLVSTLKYQGKTNEQFTALMLHLAAAVFDIDALYRGTLRVLDPVAGRGTTLNQALMWGLSPVGIDLDTKDAELYRAFLLTWLKQQRFTHDSRGGKLTRHGRSLGKRWGVEFARSKADAKQGRTQRVELLSADTTEVRSYLPRASVDVIVADLPYGVQHASRSAGKLKRSPRELLEAAVPQWKQVLAPRGVMTLAINRHTLSVESTCEILEASGVAVIDLQHSFRHRVDSSIDRDIVMARV